MFSKELLSPSKVFSVLRLFLHWTLQSEKKVGPHNQVNSSSVIWSYWSTNVLCYHPLLLFLLPVAYSCLFTYPVQNQAYVKPRDKPDWKSGLANYSLTLTPSSHANCHSDSILNSAPHIPLLALRKRQGRGQLSTWAMGTLFGLAAPNYEGLNG